MQGKVEISGISTSSLKVLKNSEMTELLRKIKQGDRQARQRMIEVAAKAAKALEKAPEDEKLKLAAENAQKAFELAKSGEKIPETFKDFLEKWVYSCEDQSALLDKLGGSRLMRLKNEPHLGYSTTH